MSSWNVGNFFAASPASPPPPKLHPAPPTKPPAEAPPPPPSSDGGCLAGAPPFSTSGGSLVPLSTPGLAAGSGAPCAPPSVTFTAPKEEVSDVEQQAKRGRGERGGKNRGSKQRWRAHQKSGVWVDRKPGEGHIKPAMRSAEIPEYLREKLEGPACNRPPPLNLPRVVADLPRSTSPRPLS